MITYSGIFKSRAKDKLVKSSGFAMMDFDAIDKQIEAKIAQAKQPTPIPTPTPQTLPQIKYPDAKYISSSRYIIRAVDENIHDFSKVLHVEVWKTSLDQSGSDSSSNTSSSRNGSYGKSVVGNEEIDGPIYLHDEWYHNQYERCIVQQALQCKL